MATSIQVVQDRVEFFADSDLLLLIHFALKSAEEDKQAFFSLDRLMMEWRAALQNSGVGTIDLNLEQVLGDPERLRAFENLLHRVQKALHRFDDPIAAKTLNTRYRVRGYKFHDYKRKRIIDAVEKIRSLLLR